MRTFKFFQKEQKIQTFDSWIWLRDVNNRKKVQYITWSEYPIDSTCRVFEGTILDFYRQMLLEGNNDNGRISPKVYEIEMRRNGYFNATYSHSNHRNFNHFVSRAWKLRIHYNL